MRERRARFAPVVDDRLRVPNHRMRRVLLHPVADRTHHQRSRAIVEVGERTRVLR